MRTRSCKVDPGFFLLSADSRMIRLARHGGSVSRQRNETLVILVASAAPISL